VDRAGDEGKGGQIPVPVDGNGGQIPVPEDRVVADSGVEVNMSQLVRVASVAVLEVGNEELALGRVRLVYSIATRYYA
jgi:hypothetical protein